MHEDRKKERCRFNSQDSRWNLHVVMTTSRETSEKQRYEVLKWLVGKTPLGLFSCGCRIKPFCNLRRGRERCFIPNILWWQQKHFKNIHWNSQSNVLLIRYNQMNSSSKLFLTPRKYDFSREKVKNEKTTFVYLQPFKKSENSFSWQLSLRSSFVFILNL